MEQKKRKKEGSVGGEGSGAERDGGALGEIRNEREEKPTHARSEELLVASLGPERNRALSAQQGKFEKRLCPRNSA